HRERACRSVAGTLHRRQLWPCSGAGRRRHWLQRLRCPSNSVLSWGEGVRLVNQELRFFEAGIDGVVAAERVLQGGRNLHLVLYEERQALRELPDEALFWGRSPSDFLPLVEQVSGTVCEVAMPP